MKNDVVVLVIEDEKDPRDFLASALERKGYLVMAAASAEEGIETVKENQIDIILLDIRLPGMNGIEALEQIRKLNPSIEIIMITAYSSIDSVIESMKKGAADYIEKPFSIEKVILAIEKAVEQRKLKDTVLLYEISRAIFSTIEMEKLLRIIVDLTMKVARADDVSVMLFNEEKQLYIAISSGLNEDIQKKTRLAIGERISGWVAQNREPLILINGLGKYSAFAGITGRDKIKSALIVPLLKNDTVIGVINANRIHLADNFSQSDLYRANIFFSLASMAIDNANLFKRVNTMQERLTKSNEQLKSTQKQLFQSEKLASLGRLVSEMAHEVNNPLMIISGNAQLCLMEDIRNEEVKNNLKIIFEESSRAKDIIQRLLKFSRSSKGELKEIDFNASIDMVVNLMEHQLKLSAVEIKKNYADNLPHAFVDEKQIQEVYMNLLNNARDAMEKGGTVYITTSVEGNFLRADFKDTGCGMTEEAKDRLFEPFFTTKEKGTGLGLSVCYGILKANNGELKFESQPQQGATATVLLPIKDGSA